ncbi:hypothetical protein [Kitasatospora nipponensis]|uniref:hypothetical protein n=1 Tax=Kitasatospora nipponensis TaxID=258049 RepID=UPI0031D360AC
MDACRTTPKVAGCAVCTMGIAASADGSTGAAMAAMLPMPTAFGGIAISALSE